MKKLTLSMSLALIICLMLSIFSNAVQVQNLTDKVIRVHIIANSDSAADQALKLEVKDSLSALVKELLPADADKKEATDILTANLEIIEKTAMNTLSSKGCSYSVNALLARRSFPQKQYEGFTLPKGEYDSLCLTIGEGKGQNFWCVLYPSLCIGAVMSIDDIDGFADEELIIIKNPEKVKYKLFCFEVWQRLKALFE